MGDWCGGAAAPTFEAMSRRARRRRADGDAARGMTRDLQLWVPFVAYAIALCFLLALALGVV